MKPALALLAACALLFAGCATSSTTTTSENHDEAGHGQASSSTAPVPLLLTVAPLAATQNDTITVKGTVSRAAQVSIGTVSAQATSAWNLVVPVEFGHSNLTVVADDGQASARLTVVAIRLASATMEVVYTAAVPPHPSSMHTVWYDPDGFASKSMYADKPRPHPGYANVHDVMVSWTEQTGTLVEYGYDDAFDFGVNAIDGVGNPLTASAPPYWGYEVNGATADLGITLQAVTAGDVISWRFLA